MIYFYCLDFYRIRISIRRNGIAPLVFVQLLPVGLFQKEISATFSVLLIKFRSLYLII